jgi:23S rRNA (uracil1939-C5)-methyltransferase
MARWNDRVLFVPFAVPGDVADIRVIRKKKNYAEGRVVRFHAFAERREVAFCRHYGVCGGCKWQILPYTEQLRCKQEEVVENLRRIGKMPLPEVSPILGSEQTRFYRNKLEYTFSDKRWMTEEELGSATAVVQREGLGFHIPGRFDKVLHIEECWLQAAPSDAIRCAIGKYCLDHGLSFFDLRQQCGLMRNLIIRTASTGEVMVIVVFFEDDRERREGLLRFVAEQFPELTSLLYIINQKANDTIADQVVHVFKGRDHIFEEMEGLRFKIGPKTFYQTNSAQAHRLYRVVREWAGLTGKELVYDLYTGAGTIANFVARAAGRVIGIEAVPEAIADAEVNARLNGIENALFFAGDMKDLLNEAFIARHGRPEVVITDPPRAGMHGDVIEALLRALPQRIIYVSCNSATQARDLQLLAEGYRVAAIQPVDMFPHTHHVENVVLLVRKGEGREAVHDSPDFGLPA